MKTLLILGVLGAAPGALLSGTETPAGAGYIMQRVSASAVAQRATSSGYVTTVTAVLVGGSAGRCPSGAATTVGFWSVLGTGPVPILLTVDKNGTNPEQVDLSWTGQARTFDVFRSQSASGLETAGNLLTSTGICSVTDSVASASTIFFYSVTKSP